MRPPSTLALTAALVGSLGFAIPAAAETTCTYDPSTKTATLVEPNTEIILYAKVSVAGGSIVYQEFDFEGEFGPAQQCDTATTTNTDVFRAENENGVVLFVDQSGGSFAPGATAEATGLSEIEFLFPHLTQLHIFGTDGPDLVRYGTLGANVNGDDDVDITFESPQSEFRYLGGAGNDDLAATGGLGTGGVAKLSFSASGGPGDDRFVGGTSLDGMVGGTGNDFASGGNGPDNLIGGPGNDKLLGGRYFDSLLGGPGNDLLKGGDRNDFLRGDSGRDRCLGGKGRDSFEDCERGRGVEQSEV